VKTRELILTRCLWSAFLAPSICLAASFDCSRASTGVERLICTNAELSQLDDVLAEAYRNARVRSPNTTQLAREQKQWLTRRNACGDNVDCIRTAYEARIKGLGPANRSPETAREFDGSWTCSSSTRSEFHDLRLEVRNGEVIELRASSVLVRGKDGADSYICEFSTKEMPKLRRRVEGDSLVLEGRDFDDKETICTAKIASKQRTLHLEFHGCSSLCPENYQALNGWILLRGTNKCRR
jgi:uncharacterized protein YecT (DUF1311 family)